ncbi:3-ketoacyl-CoA thiolase with broad chain length specificity [Serendipita sp. 405]|nr:3-ketoacyl-CoA thiolase with broad chain length specificity [Serendipita sp. 405]
MSGKAAVLAKNDDDVVVVSAYRTAITKARKGGFKDTHPEDMLAAVFRAVYTKVNLDPKLIQDISVGNVLPAGGGATVARMAQLYAGIPHTTPLNTVNRQCSSGLTAVHHIANAIKSGDIDIGIDPKTEKESEIIVDRDDGVREGVTKESLSTLKPAFSKTGTTHAGNASQVSDGAAAVLLARRSTARKLGLPILGKFVTASVVGVPPKIMGVGPAVAIPAVLKKTGLRKEDVDIYEINEAFASQAVMSVKTIGIPFEKVNINGGAIAIGHPLGATGARQVATGYALAKHTGGKIFITSMCIGSGMGMAAVFTNEQ